MFWDAIKQFLIIRHSACASPSPPLAAIATPTLCLFGSPWWVVSPSQYQALFILFLANRTYENVSQRHVLLFFSPSQARDIMWINLDQLAKEEDKRTAKEDLSGNLSLRVRNDAEESTKLFVLLWFAFMLVGRFPFLISDFSEGPRKWTNGLNVGGLRLRCCCCCCCCSFRTFKKFITFLLLLGSFSFHQLRLMQASTQV